MNQERPIEKALNLPKGACYYRCALQINPFDYIIRHNKTTIYANEDEYNKAIVKACHENGIEVIAITDHYRIKTAKRLLIAARDSGIHVFPGFEAVTKDGVHFICLFDVDTDENTLERILGSCGVIDETTISPTGNYDTVEFMQECWNTWKGVCIAAHIAADGGLLTTLKGQTAMKAWLSSELFACALSGPVKDTPNGIRQILENKNKSYQRNHAIACINAQDVSNPDDLVKPGASCWIKMSAPSIEGLRQAFLDPGSRIRLASQPMPKEHSEFLAIAWQGGFLDGEGIHFNENLNVLIGGRGTGKSTVIESIRYVLGINPLGADTSKVHEGIVSNVLRSGTKISLLIQSHQPARRQYLIERTIPNPPTVRDESGNVLNLSPSDVIPQVEIYGQHEISELTKSEEKLTHLLERFRKKDENISRRKSDTKNELERSRNRILDLLKEQRQIEERLSSLPALEETLRRFQEAGLEERLKEQSILVREERVLETAFERIKSIQEFTEQLSQVSLIDRAFISDKALEGLPGKGILTKAKVVLEKLENELTHESVRITNMVEKANQSLKTIRAEWNERKNTVQAEYEIILRELQKDKIDGEEFIRLRRQIEELRPLKGRLDELSRVAGEYHNHRRNLLAEWEDVKSEEFQQLQQAAKMVSRKLSDRVRVQVDYAGNREPLFQSLRNDIGGRLSETVDTLRDLSNLSLIELTKAMKSGRAALVDNFGIVPSQADRLAQANNETMMQIEELYLPSITRIELNVAPEGQPPEWKIIKNLSTGQKATAVLLLLLLESQAPLIVDQPEDDLDNIFISDGIVPEIREEKQQRQFLFATHNANIPVLGDAELIIGLNASGEAGYGKAEIPVKHMGSIDTNTVRELVEEVLEGGQVAFETRRLKYGF